MKKKIIPEVKKCKCGRKVLNHHWLCDGCYSKRDREKNREERIKHNLKHRKVNNEINKL